MKNVTHELVYMFRGKKRTIVIWQLEDARNEVKNMIKQNENDGTKIFSEIKIFRVEREEVSRIADPA